MQFILEFCSDLQVHLRYVKRNAVNTFYSWASIVFAAFTVWLLLQNCKNLLFCCRIVLKLEPTQEKNTQILLTSQPYLISLKTTSYVDSTTWATVSRSRWRFGTTENVMLLLYGVSFISARNACTSCGWRYSFNTLQSSFIRCGSSSQSSVERSSQTVCSPRFINITAF